MTRYPSPPSKSSKPLRLQTSLSQFAPQSPQLDSQDIRVDSELFCSFHRAVAPHPKFQQLLLLRLKTIENVIDQVFQFSGLCWILAFGLSRFGKPDKLQSTILNRLANQIIPTFSRSPVVRNLPSHHGRHQADKFLRTCHVKLLFPHSTQQGHLNRLGNVHTIKRRSEQRPQQGSRRSPNLRFIRNDQFGDGPFIPFPNSRE